MRIFSCQACGNAVHFDNTACVVCGHALGFIPEQSQMATLEPDGSDGWISVAEPERQFIFCDNAQHEACNWLIDRQSGKRLCIACEHNRMVPDLSTPENLANWRKMELAKRHLFYSLLRWCLPVPQKVEEGDSGLAFNFLTDVTLVDGSIETVLTGHDNGLITINLAEADDAERERRRTAMGEPYRTLLGHFRHEVGHYYWDRLVRDRGGLDDFRAIFGDESVDYGAALQRHYENGAPANWQFSYITAYASAHPWEDFAETWAHYLHMVDGLETASVYGLRISTNPTSDSAPETAVNFDPYQEAEFQPLLDAWIPLTVALNSLNRSLGQPDIYPFVLSPAVTQKLNYIHTLIKSSTETG